jgi:hypothetical protein
VVESDAEPRWRAQISALTDEYIFAANDGIFNKCWTINVGVVNTSHPAPSLCVLDADALVDREFVKRNLDRFDRPGTGAFQPFRDALYLDAQASARAAAERCASGAGSPDWRNLRGFLVRRTPGVCVWLRRDVFDTIHGWDERFEGWGGEDLDVMVRLQFAAALHFFDDPMLHLYHQVCPDIIDRGGSPTNTHVPLFSWAPEGPIGEIDKFRQAD